MTADEILDTVRETRERTPGVAPTVVWLWRDDPHALVFFEGRYPDQWAPIARAHAAMLHPVSGVAVTAEAFAMMNTPADWTPPKVGDMAEWSLTDDRITSVLTCNAWTVADGFETTICPFTINDDGTATFTAEAEVSTQVPSLNAQTDGDPWHETVAAVYSTLL